MLGVSWGGGGGRDPFPLQTLINHLLHVRLDP